MVVGRLLVVTTPTGCPLSSVVTIRHSESGCFVDDLTGDVGDDRSESWDFSGFVVDSGQGGHFHPDVDHSPVGALALVLVAAGEKVQEDVGSDLVDGPFVTFGFEGPGHPVDPSHRGMGVGRRQVETVEVGGAGIGHLGYDPSIFQFLLVPIPSRGRIDRDDQSLDPGTELAGGLIRRPVQRGLADLAGQFLGEMTGLIGEDPSLGQVDQTGMERLPHTGQRSRSWKARSVCISPARRVRVSAAWTSEAVI